MEILQKIESEIARFEQRAQELQKQRLSTPESAPFCWRLLPKNGASSAEVYHLTFMGIVHGNELAGLRALSEFMAIWPLLAAGTNRVHVTVILGNVEAARQNKRFIESDLNRSFAKTVVETKEQKRARELEPFLKRSRFLLDLHQTREPSVNPFFIFPLTRDSMHLAEGISSTIPIVTHWGDSFSTEGRCTDEYVNSQGGCGITLELGQNGFNDFSVSAGLRACVLAFSAVSQWSEKQDFPPLRLINEIYQTSETIKMPTSGDGKMGLGFMNFSDVRAGDEIAIVEGKSVKVGNDAKILFPYYKKVTDERIPPELCRLMYPVQRDQLPL